MKAQPRETTARTLPLEGNGILAADEGTDDITNTKRFKQVGVDSTAETRHACRKTLFRTPEMERGTA